MQTLKESRAARLLTVRALAHAAGVAPSTVYLIENRRSVPRFDAIRKLSAALGVKPSEITEFVAAIEDAGQGKDSAIAVASVTAMAS
jgi:transcriptional regulator with XRE-family HTH domain